MITIEARQLTKHFTNGIVALNNLELSIAKGEIFGLLGPNGAGKTTTVRLLNGTLAPTQGSSAILGSPAQAQAVRYKTATLTEFAIMYEQLSVMENLLFFADMYEMQPALARERIKLLLSSMQLWERRNDKLGTFSRGMKKRVQLVRTLLHQPEIIFLDEPTSGLDPESARQVIDLIYRLAKEHALTVFLCTHNLPLAAEICDIIGFIDHGQLKKSGKIADLTSELVKEQQVKITTLTASKLYSYKQKEEINTWLKQLMEKGEFITGVELVQPTLEEVYFHYIKPDRNQEPEANE